MNNSPLDDSYYNKEYLKGTAKSNIHTKRTIIPLILIVRGI